MRVPQKLRAFAPLVLLLFASILVSSLGSPALAQNYPERPIRIIAPFPPGNGSDVVARVIADELSRRLGQSVVVENRAGATGAIGAVAVKNSAPDGYTLLMTSTSFAISTALVSDLPYDVFKDFEPIARIGGGGGMVLIVEPDFPAKDLREFVDLVKKNPDKYKYAHVGRGTIQHLTMSVFLSAINGKIGEVPYKGSVQAITDMIGGRLPVMFDAVGSSAPFIDQGKVKALMISADRRSKRLPNVPTVGESKVSELEKFRVNGWVGLLAPAKTPGPIITKVNEAVMTVLAMPDIQSKLFAAGYEVEPQHSAADFGQFLRDDIARWQAAANAAKIEKEPMR